MLGEDGAGKLRGGPRGMVVVALSLVEHRGLLNGRWELAIRRPPPERPAAAWPVQALAELQRVPPQPILATPHESAQQLELALSERLRPGLGRDGELVRRCAGKHDYLDEFARPFGARFLASQRFRPPNIRSVHADGNAVIVLWDGRGIAVDGNPMRTPMPSSCGCVTARSSR